MSRITFPALALAMAASLAQAAPREFAEQRPLNPEARLSVRNVSGVIQVEAWDKATLDIAAQLADNVENLDISGSANDLKLEVRTKKSDRYGPYDETQLHLRVPAGVALTLDGTSADLVVRGLKGALVARTVSGDVQIEVNSKQLSAQTVSGDLTVRAPYAVDTKVSTVSGDADIEGASGALSAESVSGDVRVDGGTFSRLELKSVSGDVNFHAAAAVNAVVKAESLSGDVRFDAPAALSAEVTLKTFSGERRCDFEGVSPSSDGKRTVLRLGEGRGNVVLTSFSGDVSLDKH